jgi:hypothetical protein
MCGGCKDKPSLLNCTSFIFFLSHSNYVNGRDGRSAVVKIQRRVEINNVAEEKAMGRQVWADDVYTTIKETLGTRDRILLRTMIMPAFLCIVCCLMTESECTCWIKQDSVK